MSNLKSPNKVEDRIIRLMIFLGVFSVINFLYFFFQSEFIGNKWIFGLLAITVVFSMLKKLYMWYNYLNISIPKTSKKKSNLKVDILTTYFPGEPYQMTITTLEAIQKIEYPHTTYLCDEANDPFLKKFCLENNINHVIRNNRINAKAGNINNALDNYATGDICVVLDPDHIPQPDFLDPILPHFEDSSIGFVQIVQSYYNIGETLVARGAAEQTFQFYGPMMMTLNAYGAVNAIGANCVFRRKALDSIGGHAPGLCEDMHTAMLLYSKKWNAVYVPKVLAEGLAPSNLTSFFKQQLKWSRGTFDLLFKVYPKIFTNLTVRQKIHFGILPLHYLCGVISLINFLIPILSLLFFVTPWHGNIVDFALVLLPVIASSILIRTFIQKWVIQKKERGFHIIGGLLQINTWWIYIVGFFYTLIDKKVPYLPTPKENEWESNFKIVIPNIIIGVLSIIAIIFGLNKDLTPFSIIMAGFAFFNACIMAFGVYLGYKVTNENQILRSNLGNSRVVMLRSLKNKIIDAAHLMFSMTRKLAFPLLIIIIAASMGFKIDNEFSKWKNIQPQSHMVKKTGKYFGIFYPENENGLSRISNINILEQEQEVDFNLISIYLAWNPESINRFPHGLMDAIYLKDAIPMITWEPWASLLPVSDSIPKLQDEKQIFKYIIDGYFDEYIKDFAKIIKSYNKPIFLRYAHEFDNPQYPWYTSGRNSTKEFTDAWKHVHTIFKEQNANNVVWVWNPWRANNMAAYYPGNDYVDWIGLTMLNYAALKQDNEYQSFEEMYKPFQKELHNFSEKPVMLAEFGALNLGYRQQEWTLDAVKSITNNHPEISAIVMFYSDKDKNIPNYGDYDGKYLDWTNETITPIGKTYIVKPIPKISNNVKSFKNRREIKPINKHQIRGVRYKKGQEWQENYYNLGRRTLKKDFEIIKNSGFNTIQFKGGNIYDHNLLSYSKKYDLNIIYQFDIDNSIDFISQKGYLNNKNKAILKKVKELKNDKHVLGYIFEFNLQQHFLKPLLNYERSAYLNWLKDLTEKIKTIDPTKSVAIELVLDDETIFHIKEMLQEYHLPIDSFGLIVKDTVNLQKVKRFIKKENISIFFSNLDPKVYNKYEENLVQQDIVLHNWQDEMSSNKLTFDGLLDPEGRKKRILKQIENTWNLKKEPVKDLTFRILRPATPLYSGFVSTYHATVFDGKKWALGDSYNDYTFEWSLIKKDSLGFPLARKQIGKGAILNLKIPEDYELYDLMLTAVNKKYNYVTTVLSILNTPLTVE